MVAANFRAGGYLAKYFSDVMTGGEADENLDGALSLSEIEDDIRLEYSEEKQESASRDIGYQQLRVEPGTVDCLSPLLFI